jgi:hypothetical protein
VQQADASIQQQERSCWVLAAALLVVIIKNILHSVVANLAVLLKVCV